ncbi:MAG: 3'-5' exoribonuclease YhaM family protein [Cellulosilyticaceae bacterium]
MSLISSLKPNETIKGYYLCKYKQILKNKTGKEYGALRLQDKTGSVDAKIWAFHSGINDFEVEDVVLIEGEVILYQDNLQLNISKLQKAKPEEYDLTQFIPSTTKDVDVLEKELFALIDSVENSYIKKLLEEIFYDEAIYSVFMKNGAAKSVHHAYLNGLLEHTVTVAKIGNYLSDLYTGVNKDCVIAGCLLHDIGKIYELSSFPKNDYTDEGQLLGHIVMGAEKIHDVARTIEQFPKEIELLLKHIILAHHGEYEYGSPKRPKCIEAMIVHLADNTDSKVKMVEEMLMGSPDEDQYAGYNKILNRNIRKIKL